MADLGNFSLYIALCALLFVACTPIMEYCYLQISYKALKITWLIALAFILVAFLSLIYCYVVSDFSVLNVVSNSHRDKPLLYKVSGAWGNHEGSMLLWITAISFFSVLSGFLVKHDKLGKMAMVVQACLNSFFVAFTIFASNPFVRIFPAPVNGFGLNPILQDVGLAMHPPMLYLGYVGFSASYSVTIAALLCGQINKIWSDLVRMFTIISWFFLTIGIALGSWWAYRELGWGGFWFWDPVENASLMPWLSATALLHAIAAYHNTGHMKQWSTILAISTFILSVLGMFLVRSGIVTSVHAFAVDSSRGIVILIFLATLITGSACVYFMKAVYESEQQTVFTVYSKLFFININNLFLAVAIFVVAMGTLYPMIIEIINGTAVSVGPPYFNKVFNPLITSLAGFCFLGSGLPWYRGSAFKKHFVVLGLAMFIALSISLWLHLTALLHIAAVAVGITLILGNVFLIYETKNYHVSKLCSMLLGHTGLGFIIISIAIHAGLQTETEQHIRIGESIKFLNYDISLTNNFYEKRSNHIAQISSVRVVNQNIRILLKPEIRFFPVEGQQTIEAAIYKQVFTDLYISIDRAYGPDGTVIRIYNRPMMAWLWFGAILLALAGLCSITLYFKRIAKYKDRLSDNI